MKFLKVFLIALLAFFTFGAAQAQIVVRAHVGPRYHHRWHRHHWHHRHWHR